MNALPDKSQNILRTKIPLYITVIIMMIFALIIYQLQAKLHVVNESFVSLPVASSSSNCSTEMNQIRSQGFQFTHPLILTDLNVESEDLTSVKLGVQVIIDEKIRSGMINTASVYVRKMNGGGWININGDERFNPGSIIKVAMLLTYLKQSEKIPGLLNKQLFFAKPTTSVPNQTFAGKPIESGKNYSIKDLLYFMIVNSDNYATLVLNQNADLSIFGKLFTDLGMPSPDVHDPDFQITTKDFSRFMRVLYSSTYLNSDNSEFALSLLSQSSFKDGMVKYLPADIKVAHKFGEQMQKGIAQLHESGIVYDNNSPYLITIMTKGRDIKVLPAVISEISKYVFDNMNKPS